MTTTAGRAEPRGVALENSRRALEPVEVKSNPRYDFR